MSVVAKNKITEYIAKNPEARVTLLTWLQEYPFHQKQRMFSDHEGKAIQKGCSEGNAQPDLGDYSIKFRINYPAKALLITWVGTRQEHIENNDLAFKELKSKDSMLTKSVKIANLLLETPVFEHPENSIESSQSGNELVQATSFSFQTSKKAMNPDFGNIDKRHGFEDEVAYQQGLLKLTNLFDAQPNTPGFNELLLLLDLVKNYEEYKLKFPPLQTYEVVANRMNMFNTTVPNLALVTNEDELSQFLLGKQTLSPKILAQLFKFLSIRFPVDD